MKDKYGVNYRPTFKLAKWVERPVDLPNTSPIAADTWNGASAAAPPRAVSQHVPPPAPKPAADPLAEAVF